MQTPLLTIPSIRLFDRSIAEKPPTVDHADLTSEKGMAAWTSQIVRPLKVQPKHKLTESSVPMGSAISKTAPSAPRRHKSSLSGLGQFATLITVWQHNHGTNSHEAKTDPVSQAASGILHLTCRRRVCIFALICSLNQYANTTSTDTAYTTLALEAHTDTTYFSEPAGLQLFHLLSHTSGSGGASLLVDGFAAAFELYMTDKRSYEILSTVGVYSHASGNEDVSVQPYTSFPVLVHDPYHGHLVQVRWNNADRAGIELPLGEVDVWYEAAA